MKRLSKYKNYIKKQINKIGEIHYVGRILIFLYALIFIEKQNSHKKYLMLGSDLLLNYIFNFKSNGKYF